MDVEFRTLCIEETDDRNDLVRDSITDHAVVQACSAIVHVGDFMVFVLGNIVCMGLFR
jgi:hypothetical protein